MKLTLSFLALLALLPCLSAPLAAQGCPGVSSHILFVSAEQDQVRIPNPPSGALDGFANFTIECWFRISNPNGSDTLISKWRQSTTGQTPYLIRVFNGHLQVFFTNGFMFNGTAVVTNGAWHHMAVTRTGTAVQLIVDGVVDFTTTYAPLLNSMTGPLVFGCFLDANDTPLASTFLNGSIDEVRIWNIGRTLSQIQFTKDLAIPSGTLGLVGNWRLDTGSGQVVTDETVGAAHGVLGTSNAVALNDPTWVAGGGPVLGYPCTSTTGNANSALATLLVNGLGAGPTPGPFPIQLAANGTLTLSWAGPAGKPFALLTGTNNTANTNVPGLGILDIGIPPTFGDVAVIFDGSLPQSAFFYTLGSSGTATQTFTLPPSLGVGPILTVQGLVFQPVGTTAFGSLLTAAFQLNG